MKKLITLLILIVAIGISSEASWFESGKIEKGNFVVNDSITIRVQTQVTSPVYYVYANGLKTLYHNDRDDLVQVCAMKRDFPDLESVVDYLEAMYDTLYLPYWSEKRLQTSAFKFK